MVKLLIDFIQFLNTLAPLLMALAVLTLLSIVLSKSIKKHATVYYIVFAIPFVLVAIPFIGRLFGVEMFSFNRIPFLGSIIRDYIHAGTLGFPLLVIIMYMGALNPKILMSKKLLGIRKELSILSGFPIFTHSLLRVTHNFPNALRFFTDYEGYMAGGRVTNALGAGISSFSFVLGAVMLALFIPLWVTSFDAVRKRMGSVKWKKLQRWSYALYAMLFIHAMGIQVGGMLNPRGGGRPQPEVEAAATIAAAPDSLITENRGLQQQREESEGGRNVVQPAGSGDDHTKTESPSDSSNRAETARPAAGGGRQPSLGFADIKVGSQTKRYIHIASLLLIFGSYLYLRLRKAKQDQDFFRRSEYFLSDDRKK